MNNNQYPNQWNSGGPQQGPRQQGPAQQRPNQWPQNSQQSTQQYPQHAPQQQYPQQPPQQQQSTQQYQQPAQPPQQPTQEEPRKKRVGLIVAIAAIAALLGPAAAAGTIIYLSNKDDNPAANAHNSARFEPSGPAAEGEGLASDENEGDADGEISADEFKLGTDEYALRFAVDGHTGDCMFATGSDFVYRCKTSDIPRDLEFKGDNGSERLTQIHLYDGEPAGITTDSRVPDSDFAGGEARELKVGQRVTIDQVTCELTADALECASPTGEFRNVFGDGVYLNGARDAVGAQCGGGLRTVDGGMNCDDAKRFKEQYWDGAQFTPGPEGYRLDGARFKCESATTGTVIMPGYDGFCYSPDYETDKRSFAFRG